MKQFAVRRIISSLCTAGLIIVSNQTFASAFQLWEQDGASIGNYHAGYAAWVNDASTAWYNPAGITRFKNQQVVVSADSVLTNFKYRGNVDVNLLSESPVDVVAQGGMYALIPSLHYVAPITDCWGFGFDLNVPFGLKTNYGSSTALRYAATSTSITVINISPSLAYQITDRLSFGLGLDYQKVGVQFDLYATVNDSSFDTKIKNRIFDNAFGYHAGLLYQFTPCTRVGFSYHSKVSLHLDGTSTFRGALTRELNDGHPIESHSANSNITLPDYAAASIYSLVHPQVALMGTVIYTGWSTFDILRLRNAAGLDDRAEPTTAIEVTIPQSFRNTWNVSVGADYYLNPCFTLRGGVGYDQTPVRNKYRNVQLPDTDRYVIALGGHYKATPNVGVDVGWSHVFGKKVIVNPPPQAFGMAIVTTDGKVSGGADVYAVQLTWDIC